MKRLTPEDLRNNPELLAELQARARFARSSYAHEKLAGLFTRLKWVLEEIRSIDVPGRPAQG